MLNFKRYAIKIKTEEDHNKIKNIILDLNYRDFNRKISVIPGVLFLTDSGNTIYMSDTWFKTNAIEMVNIFMYKVFDSVKDFVSYIERLNNES